jgi:hypothetical protein
MLTRWPGSFTRRSSSQRRRASLSRPLLLETPEVLKPRGHLFGFAVRREFWVLLACIVPPRPVGAQDQNHDPRHVSWPGIDVVVSVDSVGLAVYALAGVPTEGGQTRRLSRVVVDPVTALQWAALMSRRLDTIPSGTHSPGEITVLAPALGDSCAHRWLGVGVQGADYVLAFKDSVTPGTWYVTARRKDLGHLLNAVMALAPFGSWTGCVPRPPVVVHYPSARYPRLREAQGGRVVAEMMVDTLGRPEPESIQILDKTDTVFASAFREFAEQLRFLPAEWNGRPIRGPARFTFDFKALSEGFPIYVAP